MKRIISVFFISLFSGVFAQPGNDVLRGPQNTLPDGVIDGIVVEDEVPVRSRVEYEYVRLADYAKSWRVYSRIDAREMVNTKLFYPYDNFSDGWEFPTSKTAMDKGWVRHQERFSLWTIIMTHAMLGDLTIFKVSSEENPLVEDGYQLKYAIKSKTKDDFWNDKSYRSKITRTFSTGSKGAPLEVFLAESQKSQILMKSGKSFDAWYDSLLNDPNVPRTIDGIADYEQLERMDTAYLRLAWNAAADGTELYDKDIVQPINSQCITAYNIKEDWFFDKERSVLDKRIIAIAPVARIKYDPDVNNPTKDDREPYDRYRNLISVNNRGELQVYDKGAAVEYTEEFVELELFWLYFPQLRHVLVNYYVYNDQNDAYRMSFDDLFWKRMFSARMYKKTDQYDRSVEDYRYGVDALYEAEKFKETMRTWETDLWNY